MREIKFRAKSGTQWRFGDLYHNERGELMIYEPLSRGRTLDGVPFDGWRIVVDPETVGQFTGVLDCEGREIYEGDVIQIVTKNPYWAFKKNYDVYWDLDGFCLEGEPLYYWFKLHDLKVIGNAHDNPELLERMI